MRPATFPLEELTYSAYNSLVRLLAEISACKSLRYDLMDYRMVWAVHVVLVMIKDWRGVFEQVYNPIYTGWERVLGIGWEQGTVFMVKERK